jgi:hypothetical protein
MTGIPSNGAATFTASEPGVGAAPPAPGGGAGTNTSPGGGGVGQKP